VGHKQVEQPSRNAHFRAVAHDAFGDNKAVFEIALLGVKPTQELLHGAPDYSQWGWRGGWEYGSNFFLQGAKAPVRPS
jgi:hypothetical protein